MEKGLIDFRHGIPTSPTPGLIRNHCKRAIDKRKDTEPGPVSGLPEFRKTIAYWYQNRFDVDLNPDTEISALHSIRETILLLSRTLKKDDYVILPIPTSIGFANKVHHCKLEEDKAFLLDFQEIPKEIAKKAKILWLNYPNNPTGAVASRAFYKEAIDFANENKMLIVSDETFSEIYFSGKTYSILEVSKDNVIVFNTPAIRSNMVNYNVGFLAGDVKQLKNDIETSFPGIASFIQDAAIAAYSDEKHVEHIRSEYKIKKEILVKAFKEAGYEDSSPKAGIYLWQKVDNAQDFCKRLLKKNIAVLPGSELGQEGFVRFALTPTLQDVKNAANIIRDQLND